MTVLNNTHNIGVRKSVYKKGSTINVNFEFLKNKKYLVVKAIDDSSKEKELAVGQDYSLDISDGLNGAYGVVTLLKDFDPSTEISLFREISATQKANMSSKVIFSSDFETALDRLTIMIQDLKVLINRQASKENLGIVQIGDNINVNEGLISVATAANDKLGLVKIGENLSIDADGTLDLRLPKDLCADAIKPAILPSVGYWKSVCYGAGMFVAVGGSGNIALISFDAINWLSKNLPHSDGWSSVCYGNGMFVAVQSGTGRGAYSTDGAVWIVFSLPFYAHWASVCYGGNKFVAVSRWEDYTEQTGTYSYDGVKWLPMDINVPYLSSVCYGNGMFVAVGGEKISYSWNGINWSSIGMPGTNWISVCYGNGKFVAVQSGGSDNGTYSYDGIHWERMNVAVPYLSSVCYGGNKFVAVSSDGVWTYSADGIIWIGMPAPISNGWSSVCYGGGRFVVVSGDTQAIVIPFVNGSLSTVAISGKYSDLTEKLTAGANVQINGMTVSATDTRYNNATQSLDGLMSSDDKRKVDNLSTVATTGNYNDLVNKPTNATTKSDGFMSSDDKVKLNAAMKFPDGEAGYTLPNAAGRAEKLISFDNLGSVKLQEKYKADYGIEILANNAIKVKPARTGEYDDCFGGVVIKMVPGNLIHNDNGYISVTIPAATPTESGLMSSDDKIKLNAAMKFPDGETGAVLPDVSARANKVIGFNADGKTVEMKEAGDANIKAGEGLQKNGDEISLKAAARNTLGGIKIGRGFAGKPDGTLDATVRNKDIFINLPVVTGNSVKMYTAFRSLTENMNPFATAGNALILDGKTTFFYSSVDGLFRSFDAQNWELVLKERHNFNKVLKYNDNSVIYANSNKVFLSEDCGVTFELLYENSSFSVSEISSNEKDMFSIILSNGNMLSYKNKVLVDTFTFKPVRFSVTNGIRADNKIMELCADKESLNYIFTKSVPSYGSIYGISAGTAGEIVTSFAMSSLDTALVSVKKTNGTTDIKSLDFNTNVLSFIKNLNYATDELFSDSKGYVFRCGTSVYSCNKNFENIIQVIAQDEVWLTTMSYNRGSDLYTMSARGAFLVSTKAYQIETDNMSSFAAKPLGEVEGIMSDTE